MKLIALGMELKPGCIQRFCMVDDEDYSFLNRFNWQVKSSPSSNTYYVSTTDTNRKVVYMHRFIMKAKLDEEIDHRNLHGWDNQKLNLRFCTHSQNLQNVAKMKKRSRSYKGVYKVGRKWTSKITVNRKIVYLGTFIKEIDAALAYNTAALEHFGEFARINDV